jgi:ankyrin repeat protein
MPNKKGKRKAEAARTRQLSQLSVTEINQALHHASEFNVVSSNDAKVMSAQAAIDAGADVNYSRNDCSCLMEASLHRHAKIVALLLNAGAEKDAKNENGFTALFAAVQNSHAKCIELLLNAGADKETKQFEGCTPLYMAAQEGHAECLQLLLNAGADTEAKEIKGFTALLMAAQEGNVNCVQLLLNAGADKDASNDVNSTALLMAAQNGNLKCIENLLKAGCDVNVVTKKGNSALPVAVVKNRVDCVRALVRAGADITIEVDGLTIADLADLTNNSDELRTALLFYTEKQRICEECERMTRGKMFKCGACRSVYYCNCDCQAAHWAMHKLVCTADD